MSKLKDNSTLAEKIALRQLALREISEPRIVETNGGFGMVWERCYRNFGRGVVFEVKPDRIEHLAKQRPNWAVYGAHAENALADGVGFHHRPNFFDIDPYGQCWPIVDAVMGGLKKKSIRHPVMIVVNDGLRQKLKVSGGWQVESMKPMVRKYGSGNIYAEYLAICRELMIEKSREAGFRLAKWSGQYCGHLKAMTHYAALLTPV